MEIINLKINRKKKKKKIETKIRINSLSGEKKIGEKYCSGKRESEKISLGKNLVTCKKFSHSSTTFFPW